MACYRVMATEGGSPSWQDVFLHGGEMWVCVQWQPIACTKQWQMPQLYTSTNGYICAWTDEKLWTPTICIHFCMHQYSHACHWFVQAVGICKNLSYLYADILLSLMVHGPQWLCEQAHAPNPSKSLCKKHSHYSHVLCKIFFFYYKCIIHGHLPDYIVQSNTGILLKG